MNKYSYDDVRDFANLTWKKFKKENDDIFASKKEMRKLYQLKLMELLPSTINWCVTNGYKPDNKETKEKVYAKLVEPEFVKTLTKSVKKGEEIDNIKLLPIIIKDILNEAQKANDADRAEHPDTHQDIDLSDMANLSKLILKKKMKKFVKAGIPEALAFDLLSVVPCHKAMKSSQLFRIRNIYSMLYKHETEVNIAKTLNLLVDESYIPAFITVALLEKKEFFSKMTDPQKKVYLSISNFCFEYMEHTSKDNIELILQNYVANRHRDDINGRDGNRRYALTSLSSDEYPRIYAAVNAMVAKSEENKKYLG